MQLYSILIFTELRRFMQAGIRWDFGTLQEFFGFLGMFKICPGWAAIHGLPWKQNGNMFKNKRVKCIHVYVRSREHIYMHLTRNQLCLKYLHLNTGSAFSNNV